MTYTISLRHRIAHPPTGCEVSGVSDDAVSRLHHALDLPALGALRKPEIVE